MRVCYDKIVELFIVATRIMQSFLLSQIILLDKCEIELSKHFELIQLSSYLCPIVRTLADALSITSAR